MKTFHKRDFPVHDVRRFLEPGPVVLVSSHYKGETDIMTMGWHMVMEFVPSRLGCFITPANHSYELIRKSKECVINLPTTALTEEVIGIGNSTGAEIDKFEMFGLTPLKAKKVKAPLIKECYANFECKVRDVSLIDKYGLFILEVVKAYVATSPKYPETLHYRGDGVFMISGRNVSHKRRFLPQNL